MIVGARGGGGNCQGQEIKDRAFGSEANEGRKSSSHAKRQPLPCVENTRSLTSSFPRLWEEGGEGGRACLRAAQGRCDTLRP